MANLGKIIKNLINKKFENEISRIKKNWNKIVDTEVAKNTEPTIIRKKRLNVKCNSSVWIQEMMIKKDDLIKKINEYFDEKIVEDIYFRQ